MAQSSHIVKLRSKQPTSNQVELIGTISQGNYDLIEDEHAQLGKLIQDLHDTCCNLDNSRNCGECSAEKHASCQGRFPSYIHDLINLVDTHFHHEEAIMFNRPRMMAGYEYFKAHQQAHNDIMQELRSMVAESTLLDKQGKTAESYRYFYKKLPTLFEEHDRCFDQPFIKSTLPK